MISLAGVDGKAIRPIPEPTMHLGVDLVTDRSHRVVTENEVATASVSAAELERSKIVAVLTGRLRYPPRKVDRGAVIHGFVIALVAESAVAGLADVFLADEVGLAQPVLDHRRLDLTPLITDPGELCRIAPRIKPGITLFKRQGPLINRVFGEEVSPIDRVVALGNLRHPLGIARNPSRVGWGNGPRTTGWAGQERQRHLHQHGKLLPLRGGLHPTSPVSQLILLKIR